MLLLDAGLTWLLSLPTRGRCGWACLSPAQPPIEGIRLPSDTVSSHHTAVGSGALLGDARPLDLDTYGGVDCLGTYIINVCIGCMAFTRVCLPYVGIVMMCMHVFLVKLPS
jgi:hypothetical protein